RIMRFAQVLYRLQLNDDAIVHHQIETVSTNRSTLVFDCGFELGSERDTLTAQFDCKRALINRFQEARAERTVHADDRLDDPMRQDIDSIPPIPLHPPDLPSRAVAPARLPRGYTGDQSSLLIRA